MLDKYIRSLVDSRYFIFSVDLFIALCFVVTFLPYTIYTMLRPKRLKSSTWVLEKIGIYPIRDQYYEPLFQKKYLDLDKFSNRRLGKIDFDIAAQLSLLETFAQLPKDWCVIDTEDRSKDFSIDNGAFVAGDAEFLFHFIRSKKPKRIYEIGAGQSTKVISAARRFNNFENHDSRHVCIEPFEAPWLEDLSVEVIRDKVENMDLGIFKTLESGDVLFIDSSHMIRPQGDVLTEYLEIIPLLSPGVFIHIHDIFTPHDYPVEWVMGEKKFWNEQYLVEMMLIHSDRFKVIASLNHLKHSKFAELKNICPNLQQDSEPGSIYLQVVG